MDMSFSGCAFYKSSWRGSLVEPRPARIFHNEIINEFLSMEIDYSLAAIVTVHRDAGERLPAIQSDGLLYPCSIGIVRIGKRLYSFFLF